MQKKYVPCPVDISDVELGEDIKKIAELLAKNTHEVWASSRIAEGWTYGPERNDALKQTPCLVPYESLTETEKDYDRNTALNTLKLIVKMGYTIEKK